MVRRAIAAGAVILVLILIVIGVRGCLSSRQEQSLRDYDQKLSEIVQESNTDVGKPLFAALGKKQAPTSAGTLALQNQVNQIKATADEEINRAQGLDVPDEMKPAQQNLLLALQLRAHAIGKIAEKVPAIATPAGRDPALQAIAGQMQALMASDVVYSQLVKPNVEDALDKAGIENLDVPNSQMVTSLSWLDPTQVAAQLGTQFVGQQAKGPKGKPAPGPHGTSLESVSIAGTQLTPDSDNTVKIAGPLVVSASFLNDANDETNVTGTVEISGSGQPITASKSIPKVAAGAQAKVDIPLPTAPPVGTPLDMKVTIAPVPGEQTVDNNTMTFTVTFQR